MTTTALMAPQTRLPAATSLNSTGSYWPDGLLGTVATMWTSMRMVTVCKTDWIPTKTAMECRIGGIRTKAMMANLTSTISRWEVLSPTATSVVGHVKVDTLVGTSMRHFTASHWNLDSTTGNSVYRSPSDRTRTLPRVHSHRLPHRHRTSVAPQHRVTTFHSTVHLCRPSTTPKWPTTVTCS